MEMLVTKFSNGKYRNEGELFQEPISNENVKLMGEMIALQALRTVKKYDKIFVFRPEKCKRKRPFRQGRIAFGNP